MKVHTEGTGLNLNVAKLIIESLGGEISFESKVNKGTTFMISLPIKISRTKLKTS